MSEFEGTLDKEQRRARIQKDSMTLEVDGLRKQLQEREAHIATLEERVRSAQTEHDKLQRLLTNIQQHESAQGVLVRDLKDQIETMSGHMRKLEQIAGEKGYEATKCRKEKEEAEAAAAFYVEKLRDASRRCELLEEASHRMQEERLQRETNDLKRLKRNAEFSRLRGGASTANDDDGDVRPSVLLAEHALQQHASVSGQIGQLQGQGKSATARFTLRSEIEEMRSFLSRVSDTVKQREKEQRKEVRRMNKRWQFNIENNIKEASPLLYAASHPHPPLPAEVYQHFGAQGGQPSEGFSEDRDTLLGHKATSVESRYTDGGVEESGAHTPEEQLEPSGFAHRAFGRQTSNPHWEVSVSTMSSNAQSRLQSAMNTPERLHNDRFHVISPQRYPTRGSPYRHHVSSDPRDTRRTASLPRRRRQSIESPTGNSSAAAASHHVSSFAHGQPWRPKHTPPSPSRRDDGGGRESADPSTSHAMDLGLRQDDEQDFQHHRHEHHHHEHRAAAASSALTVSPYLDTPSSQRSVGERGVRLSSGEESSGAHVNDVSSLTGAGDGEGGWGVEGIGSDVGVFVESLRRSRANILATGAYTENDELVRQMDERIARYTHFLKEKRF